MSDHWQIHYLFSSLFRLTAKETRELSSTDHFVMEIPSSSVNSYHKGPVKQKASPCHDVIMAISLLPFYAPINTIFEAPRPGRQIGHSFVIGLAIRYRTRIGNIYFLFRTYTRTVNDHSQGCQTSFIVWLGMLQQLWFNLWYRHLINVNRVNGVR